MDLSWISERNFAGEPLTPQIFSSIQAIDEILSASRIRRQNSQVPKYRRFNILTNDYDEPSDIWPMDIRKAFQWDPPLYIQYLQEILRIKNSPSREDMIWLREKYNKRVMDFIPEKNILNTIFENLVIEYHDMENFKEVPREKIENFFSEIYKMSLLCCAKVSKGQRYCRLPIFCVNYCSIHSEIEEHQLGDQIKSEARDLWKMIFRLK